MLISTIILAGGQGARMNKLDKGWVSYRGKPLIQYALDTAQEISSDIIISCNRNVDMYRELGYPIVTDKVATDSNELFPGPLFGILAAVKLVKHPVCCVIPCDTPMLDSKVLAALYNQHNQHNQHAGFDLCVAHDSERLQPLIFVAQTQAIDSIQEYLETGSRSVTGWIKSSNHKVVKFPKHPETFRNLNSLDQLEH